MGRLSGITLCHLPFTTIFITNFFRNSTTPFLEYFIMAKFTMSSPSNPSTSHRLLVSFTPEWVSQLPHSSPKTYKSFATNRRPFLHPYKHIILFFASAVLHYLMIAVPFYHPLLQHPRRCLDPSFALGACSNWMYRPESGH